MPENMTTSIGKNAHFLFKHLLQSKKFSFGFPCDTERYKAFGVLCLHLYCTY